MTSLKLALVGAPNSGKTTLFNGLTGGLAKTANYSGVTVETRSGHFKTPIGVDVEVMDLPGIYGLEAHSVDERVAVDAIAGNIEGKTPPDALVVVVDAAHLRTHLHTVLQMKTLGKPIILALNMIDLAERDGVKLDIDALEKEVGVPVVTTRATRSAGRQSLLKVIDDQIQNLKSQQSQIPQQKVDIKQLQSEARAIANKVVLFEPVMNKVTRNIDKVVLHPVGGIVTLFVILFFMFQAVFSWATPFMDLIEVSAEALGNGVAAVIPDGLFQDLIVEGVIAGVGSVVVFLPQIIILFCFILLLDASGYMARAAFVMDEAMMRVGLNGRAFIPLLSSFACAIPGVMAARTIENEKDRLTTIMVAPLMTCSARIPVYVLIIGAFFSNDQVWGPIRLQGLVMFGLYLAGIVSAILVAFVLKKTATKGPSQPLIMELPTYKVPQPRDFFLGLWSRVWAFLKRAGTIIFATSVILWALVTFPLRDEPELRTSIAGKIGSVIEPIFAPIGFNLEMVISLIPGMAAREVAVSVLGTVYAIEGGEENTEGLSAALQNAWSLPTALAFLAWFVYAPQCFATLATVRRETNSWKWTLMMTAYLFGLAYAVSGITYWVAKGAGL
ncbi:ferrous iron transporter B [Hirschia baltica]|uniref:Ferrous iron transport protein B n=1 Tax=Hirschia baltica (strain ATCC 49814 / DSM 5838 / IFAM 1418) TaxID=582402 RepID=C6XLY7_HIRBI|nr:ferrous iron transporter B [Hirschia baltica]ACT59819.1 ferrous iron transport protein B [Hirschia baltica ATCC 49814]